MNELFGPVRLEQLKRRVADSASEELRNWVGDHGRDLADTSISYLQDLLTVAETGTLELVFLDPQYDEVWVAYRATTTQMLEDGLAQRVRMFKALNGLSQAVLTVLSVALTALL